VAEQIGRSREPRFALVQDNRMKQAAKDQSNQEARGRGRLFVTQDTSVRVDFSLHYS